MNKQAYKLLCDFYNSVYEYIRLEYKPKWSRIYRKEENLEDMIHLTGNYYFGGNTVPETAGYVIAYLKKHNYT